eukprot:m.21967 g.21967  ORF g.21967 m.21967 type:complete len:279 (-) comp13630_c0_seq1:210-1046(-)
MKKVAAGAVSRNSPTKVKEKRQHGMKSQATTSSPTAVVFVVAISCTVAWWLSNSTSSKASFSGSFVNNEKNGLGTMEWEDGSIYEGMWKDDVFNGQGQLNTKEGVYEGAFVDGLRHGKGKMRWSNGQKYTGGWFNDEMHGKGTLREINGDKYFGSMEANIKSGKGTLTYKNIEQGIYVGDFQNGVRHGKGVQTLPGGKYDGDWDDDAMHGRGTMTVSSGTEITGDWVRNKIDVNKVAKDVADNIDRAVEDKTKNLVEDHKDTTQNDRVDADDDAVVVE